MKVSLKNKFMVDLLYHGGEYIVIILVDKDTSEIYDYYHDMKSLPDKEVLEKYRLDTMYLKDVKDHIL